MKKLIILVFMLVAVVSMALAQQKQAEIKFEKTTHDFGKFSESKPIQKCVFVFTNIGNAPLIINKAIASCGCTASSYTKEPIKPGEKGQIKVTYNGKGTLPARFKKTITIQTNGVMEMTRLYIKGEMTADK